MSTEFEEPPRLLSQSCSELELAILRSGCDVPSDPLRHARVLAAVGVGTAVALGTKSTWAAVAGWKKLVIGGAIACSGVGGVLVYSAFEGSGSNETNRSASAPAVGVAEPSVAEPSVAEPSVAEPNVAEPSVADLPNAEDVEAMSPEPSAESDFEVLGGEEAVLPSRHGAKRRVAKRPPAERSMDTVSGELALLDEAREALRGGDPGGALRHLGGYSRSFPTGKLRLEAEALRIEALSASGKRAEASRRAQRLLEHHPNSVLAPRLRKYVID